MEKGMSRDMPFFRTERRMLLMTDGELAAGYLPVIHFDLGETIPLRAIGWTVFRETARSASFPKRTVPVEGRTVLAIEYAFYWDYDIQHMYDLEHIWVMTDTAGQVLHAEGSFHGKYLNLWDPGMEKIGAIPPENGHVHAFCQPGKHAFLPAGELFRLVPGWRESCTSMAGGPVLTGGPFEGVWQSTPEEDRLSEAYLRETLAFEPTLSFRPGDLPAEMMPWTDLAEKIPSWIAAECGRLKRRAT